MARYVYRFGGGVAEGKGGDKNLLRGHSLSGGDPTPFFTRPSSAVLATLTIGSFLWSIPALREPVKRVVGRAIGIPPSAPSS